MPPAERLPLAGILGGGLLLAALRFNDIFPLNGDNGVYLLLARNLVTGQPYNNAGFPWGYPVLLAPGVAFFGADHLLAAVPWLKGLSVGGFLLALGLLYALFRTRHSRAVAGLTVALFAVNDIALFYTNDLLTELPYLAATAGALLYWQRRIDPAPGPAGPTPAPGAVTAPAPSGPAPPAPAPRPLPSWLLAAALLVLPYYLRTIGLALLGAAPLVLLWRRRWRAAAGLLLALAVLAAPWAAFSVLTDPDRNYTAAFWLRDPYHPDLGRIAGPGEFLDRFDGRVALYGGTVLPAMLLPQPADPAAPLRTLGGPLLLGGVILGYGLRLRRRVALPEVYVAGFLVILCSWWWTGDRFLLPVLPFLLHYLAETLAVGAGLVARLLRAPRLAGAAPALLALLLLPNLLQDAGAVGSNLRYLGGDQAVLGLSPEDRVYLQACTWLEDHTPGGSVVLARKPSISEVFAGRPSELIPLIAPDQYLPWLRSHRISYVLADSFLWSVHTTDYLRPAMARYPDHFRLLMSFAPPAPTDPPTEIWQFIP